MLAVSSSNTKYHYPLLGVSQLCVSVKSHVQLHFTHLKAKVGGDETYVC